MRVGVSRREKHEIQFQNVIIGCMEPEEVVDYLLGGPSTPRHNRRALIALLTECLPAVRRALCRGEEVLPQFISSADYVAFLDLLESFRPATTRKGDIRRSPTLIHRHQIVAQGGRSLVIDSSSKDHKRPSTDKVLRKYDTIHMNETGHPYESIFKSILVDAEHITSIDIDETFVNEPHQVGTLSEDGVID